jgi:hypothetical protein
MIREIETAFPRDKRKAAFALETRLNRYLQNIHRFIAPQLRPKGGKI